MRTNIDIDDALMTDAMRAGPYSTKREAVEAGLQLLAKQAAYRDLLGLRGKLQWSDDATGRPAAGYVLQESAPPPYARSVQRSRSQRARGE
jgi:antitoxin ParD1/3/4